MNKVVLGSLVLAVAAAFPQRADACSMDASTPAQTCHAASWSVAEGTQIPPKAPALSLWTNDSRDFALADAAGQIVPTTVERDEYGAYLLKLGAALAPNGEYRVTYKDPCGAATPADAATKTFNFRTSADVPLPTTLGQVTHAKKMAFESVKDSCGTERERKLAAFTTLTLTPSADLAPWLPLMELSASIDFGPGGVSRQAALQQTQSGKIVLNDFTAFCDANNGQLPAGVYDVTVRARLPGASTQPAPITLSVDMRCDATPDAGAPPPGFGGVDGGVDMPDVARETEDDSCALGNSSHGAWTLALALAALLRRRITRAR